MIHNSNPCNFKLRNLRTDAYEWQYVHESIEVQVDSAKEALETFYRGQKRRREAKTALNDQSSRSHSIFNIRKYLSHIHTILVKSEKTYIYKCLHWKKYVC